jgi:hypothetical protein
MPDLIELSGDSSLSSSSSVSSIGEVLALSGLLQLVDLPEVSPEVSEGFQVLRGGLRTEEQVERWRNSVVGAISSSSFSEVEEGDSIFHPILL